MTSNVTRQVQTRYDDDSVWNIDEQSYLNRTEAQLITDILRDCGANSVLEVGCGRGRVTSSIVDTVDSAVALDFTASMVDSVNSRFEADECSIVQASADALPFSDSSFDAIIAAQVVGNFATPHVFIAEASRVLTPNGTLVVTTGNKNHVSNFLDQLKTLARSTRSDPKTILDFFHSSDRRRFWIERQNHYRDSVSTLQDVFEEGGIDVVSTYGVGPFPNTVYSAVGARTTSNHECAAAVSRDLLHLSARISRTSLGKYLSRRIVLRGSNRRSIQ